VQEDLSEMRKLTWLQMRRSTRTEVIGVAGNCEKSDDILRKGTARFELLRVPLDAWLLPDVEEDEADLPSHPKRSGVVAIGGYWMNSGELLRYTASYRGDERGIERE
jgi:hypothetical protein